MMLQLLFMSALLIPETVGRSDVYRAFVRTLTSYVVSFGPMALLVYVLYQVSRLS
jgi:hypothetical protein